MPPRAGVRGAPGRRSGDSGGRARARRARPRVARIATSSGGFTDSDVVLDFLASEAAPRLAALGTSCPDHFLRTKVRPLLLDLPADARSRSRPHGCASSTPQYRDAYRRVLRRARDAGVAADARRRSGDRARPRRRHVDLRRRLADRARRGRVLRQRDQRDARRRGALVVRADRRLREVPRRVLGARGAQAPAAAARAAARPAASRSSPAPRRASASRSRSGSHGRGAAVVIADIERGSGRPRGRRARGPGPRSRSRGRRRRRESRRRPRSTPQCSASAASTSSSTTPALASSAPLARDGGCRLGPAPRRDRARLVPRQPRGGPGDVEQGSAATSSTSRRRTRSSPAPNNVAYGSGKAAQAHQVRLLAAELGAASASASTA